nr:MAG TPA: hypothetical protein [Bacteriophage sp.]DAZ78790.1 MAG TPA: hypothetical protein [Caudoviricetes sp.]
MTIDLLKFLLYYQNHNTKFPLILNFSLSTRFRNYISNV